MNKTRDAKPCTGKNNTYSWTNKSLRPLQSFMGVWIQQEVFLQHLWTSFFKNNDERRVADKRTTLFVVFLFRFCYL